MADYLTSGQIKKIVKQIERHKAGLVKHRDALRDLVGELEALGDTSSDAVDNLEYAIEALSQYV